MKDIQAKVTDFFGAEGWLSSQGFNHRAQQAKFSNSIIKSITEHDVGLLVGEAGIGKTLAYLLPLALFSRERKQRVAISTYTINLIDQLVEKEVPVVNSYLVSQGQLPLRVAKRIGMSHFVNPDRFDQVMSERFGSNELPNEYRFFKRWINQSYTAGNCIFEDWYQNYSDQLPEGISEDDIRLHKTDKSGDECYLRMIENTNDADLVVTSHATCLTDLYFNHAVLNSSDDPFAIILFDEADKVIEVAESFYNKRLQISHISRSLKRAVKDSTLAEKPKVQGLIQLIDELAQWTLTQRNSESPILSVMDSKNEEIKEGLIERLKVIHKKTGGIIKRDLTKACIDSTNYSDLSADHKYIERYLNDLTEKSSFQERSLAYSDKRSIPSLMSSTVLPAKVFNKYLKTGSSLIFTSATLADKPGYGAKFSQFKNELFFDPETRIYENWHSPESYGSVKFRLPPAHIPAPILNGTNEYNHEWFDYLIEEAHSLSNEGPLLVITPSYREAELIAQSVSVASPVLLHKRGESLQGLAESFKLGGVLISPSVWEGFSLVKPDGGQYFKNVLISRVPFSPPNEVKKELFVRGLMRSRKITMNRTKAISFFTALSFMFPIKQTYQAIGRPIRAEHHEAMISIADPRFPLPNDVSKAEKSQIKAKAIPSLINAIPERFVPEFTRASRLRIEPSHPETAEVVDIADILLV